MRESTFAQRELNRAFLARHLLLSRERVTPLAVVEKLAALQIRATYLLDGRIAG